MILTIIISLLTVLPLAQAGYFPMHDDLQVMRLFQIEKCFMDGQIPCRWAPDMAFGYGQAVFNFYSALPYYLGVLLRLLLPLSIIGSAKLLFAISLVAGSIGVYFLAREFFGRVGGTAAAILYTLAPYRALNVYVRGALAESFSLSILPFLWLFIYKCIKSPSYKNSALLALSLGALLITHNVSILMYFAFTAIWTLFWLVKNLNRKSILSLLLGGLLGLGLSGFFFIPVILETALIKGEIFVSEYSYFAGHFTTLRQLFFSRFWGFGGSTFGEEDSMSFQVGWPHWWIAVLVGMVAIYKLFKKDKRALMVLGLLAMATFALFLTHNKSTPLWISFAPLTYVQFPWRFVGMATFLISFAAGGISLLGSKVFKNALVVIFVILGIVLNINYFKPERMYDWLTDDIKLSGVDFEVQQGAAYLDYLPETVKDPPVGTAFTLPEVVEGQAEIPNFTKRSNSFFFDANVQEKSLVDIPIIYFPQWEVYLLSGQGIPINAYPSDKKGLIRVELPEGKHMVYGRFVNTPARNYGNLVTGVSFFALALGFVIDSKKRATI